MAFPWLAALKIIPWKDVVEAAPAVVAAAKSLRKGQAQSAPEPSAQAPLSADAAVAQLQRRSQDQEQRLQALQTTVADLAEQNLRLVGAVDLLRRRTRWLMAGCALALLLVLVLGWRLTA